MLVFQPFCVEKLKVALTIKAASDDSPTHPTIISDPIGLPLKVNAKLIHPVVTTVI